MTGRKIPEWIGKTDDSMPPPLVRLRIFERYGGVCQLSTRKIEVGDEWHLDHKKPLWDGGENRESNLWPVLGPPHREKTALEASQRAEGRHHRAKQAGIKTKKWRSFETNRDGPYKAKVGGGVVPRNKRG